MLSQGNPRKILDLLSLKSDSEIEDVEDKAFDKIGEIDPTVIDDLLKYSLFFGQKKMKDILGKGEGITIGELVYDAIILQPKNVLGSKFGNKKLFTLRPSLLALFKHFRDHGHTDRILSLSEKPSLQGTCEQAPLRTLK